MIIPSWAGFANGYESAFQGGMEPFLTGIDRLFDLDCHKGRTSITVIDENVPPTLFCITYIIGPYHVIVRLQ